MIDASHIKGGLWQGSYPHPDDARELAKRFDVIYFCATEYQPDATKFRGITCRYVRMQDAGTTQDERNRIIDASALVAEDLADKLKVLVTCRQGANRSGVVTAAALIDYYWMSPRAAIALVRQKRKIPTHDPNGRWDDDWTWRGRAVKALYNEEYVDFLMHDFLDEMEERDRKARTTQVSEGPSKKRLYLEPLDDDELDGLHALATTTRRRSRSRSPRPPI